MSDVTDVILSWAPHVFDDEEDAAALLQQVNQSKAFKGQQGFVLINAEECYGGSRWLGMNIAIGAFNYLDLEGLIAHLRTLQWKFPETVQLMVCGELDDKFRLIDVFSE